ncbi:MAG: exodeoxyribonuclease VII large subunit [Planctomycetota bacterium]
MALSRGAFPCHAPAAIMPRMSGRIDLDSATERLRITFPYHPHLVDIVRSFEGRRFIKQERAWYVPASEVVTVVEALRARHFDISDQVHELYEKASGTPLALPPRPVEESLTVSMLNERARQAIVAAFPSRVWIVGEITGFDRWRHKRHVHFQLTEKLAGEGDQLASVNAVLFEEARVLLEERLAAASEPFELRDGIEVRLLVRVDLYPQHGTFQVVVEDIDPVHTLGKLALRRQMILEELERRGLLDRNLRLPLPELPLRIGLITSYGSDAYNDFLSELSSSGYAFEITVYDAVMQGPRLEPTVLAGLDFFARCREEIDVLVITRGGGSRADLAWFDTLAIALAVAQHPVKTICGIGHYRDVAIIDLLALSAKTPTASAALLVERVRAVEERLLDWARRTERLARERLHGARHGLAACAQALGRQVRALLRAERQRVGQVAGGLRRGVRKTLSHAHQQSDTAQLRLQRRSQTALTICVRHLQVRVARLRVNVGAGLRATRRELQILARGVSLSRLCARIHRIGERIESHAERLRALDPRRVLERGYAIVRKSSGELVTRVDQVVCGSDIRARLTDGEIRARVTGTAKGETEPSP